MSARNFRGEIETNSTLENLPADFAPLSDGQQSPQFLLRQLAAEVALLDDAGGLDALEGVDG